MQSDSTPAATESSADPILDLGNRAAVVCMMAFLVFLVVFGACICGVVLKEPDICFLLASGRWIVQHGHLPQTDPFSYTTHYHWAKYVIEKWLTEVIFYDIWAIFGSVGLLVFDACVLAVAFVVMPMRVLYLGGWRGVPALLLTVLAVWTSFSHLAVRPEIFSFLILAIFMEIFMRLSAATAGNTRIDWKAIALAGVLVCLWSNLHTLFLFGVLLPAMYSGCMFVEKLLPDLRDRPLNWTAPILLAVCLLASLFNPYGVGLWQYLPNVFGPFNDTNNERQPIKLSNAISPVFWPFYLIGLWGLIALYRRGIKRPLKQGDLFFRLLIPAGIAGGIKTIRSIPLADWFIVSGLARTPALRPAKSGEADGTEAGTKGDESGEKLEPTASRPNRGLGEAVNERLNILANPMGIRWPLLCVLTTAIGTYCLTFAVTPEIPQGSKAFSPPVKAVKFIDSNPPRGNLLNDADFGDVMMWQMEHNPPVFIDTRYNLFGNGLLQDYWKMVKCQEGWEGLLSKYQIDWVFLPPNLELPKRLANDKAWQKLYSDNDSVIYARNQNHSQAKSEAH
jgi:hypothetical protein